MLLRISRSSLSGRGTFSKPRQGLRLGRSYASTTSSTPEEVHSILPEQDELDRYLDELAHMIPPQDTASIHDTYYQYHEEAGTVIDRVVPYEERPSQQKRADAVLDSLDREQGDGLVLVVHAQLDRRSTHLTKTTVCSGFVVNASLNDSNQGDTIVTCAHTFEEVRFPKPR